MKTTLTVLSSLLLLCSCEKNNLQEEIVAPKSAFNLEQDIYNFSEKLPEGDTLKIQIDLSLCSWIESNNLLVIKRSNELYIEGEAIQYIANPYDTIILPTRKLNTTPKDTLTFENYFRFLKLNEPTETKRPIVLVSYQNDSLWFNYKGSIGDKSKKIEYYGILRNHLYPNNPEFNLYPPPPPPPPLPYDDEEQVEAL